MWRLRSLGLVLVTAVAVAAAMTGVLWMYRPGMDAYAAHHYQAAPSPGAVTATWFGVTAVVLSDGDSSIFIDPFFTRPEGLLNLVLDREIAPDETLIRRGLEEAGIERLDAVLVSHSHFDHGMDAGVVAKLTGATLLGSESTANIGRGNGLAEAQIRVIQPGVAMQIGTFKVTFIESRHAGATGGAPTGDITQPLIPPARYFDYKLGGAYSLLLEHRQGAVLHHGSAGFVPGALAGRHADIALLGIAVVDDLDVYLREVVDAVGAKRIMPTHWDDFTRSLDEPLSPMPVAVRLDTFFDEVKRLRPQAKVETLQLGNRVALFPAAGGSR
jgi:L-ascorbate metabolism protein UlaG (beta-lactamase superfamily)